METDQYDIIIIGGGAAGASCALVLGSAVANEAVSEKRILVIDDGKSDILSGVYNNALGVPVGTTGPELWANLQRQMAQYPNVDQLTDTAKEVKQLKKGGYRVKTRGGYKLECTRLVLATGMKKWRLQIPGLEPEEHPRSPKPGRVWIPNQQHKVGRGLYVAGLLAGWSTQFSIAAGSGAQVAADILGEWAGKNVAVHDKMENGKAE
jgi:alkyl hydroperoxide reductase subunit AhpF